MNVRRAIPAAVASLLVALLVTVGFTATASASRMHLSVSTARVLAKRTARHVKHSLADDGARRAGLAGCWRNSRTRVSCFMEIKGHDTELDFRWTCMLRVAIQVRKRPVHSKRFKYHYGHAVCG